MTAFFFIWSLATYMSAFEKYLFVSFISLVFNCIGRSFMKLSWLGKSQRTGTINREAIGWGILHVLGQGQSESKRRLDKEERWAGATGTLLRCIWSELGVLAGLVQGLFAKISPEKALGAHMASGWDVRGRVPLADSLRCQEWLLPI